MKSVKPLFFGFLAFILLCVLVLRPVDIPENESELLVAKGEVTAIVEGPGQDIVFKLKDDNRRFYINRGLEQGLSIQDLQAKLMGRQITLKYPKHWSLMDPAGNTQHLSMVKYSGGTVFSELEIKEFLETNYPRGRAIGVFRWFHFDLKVKNRNAIISPLPDPLLKGEGEIGNPEAKPRGILFD